MPFPTLPSDILRQGNGEVNFLGPITTDTETSGLYADDGARISTASIAWLDPLGDWANTPGITRRLEVIVPGELEAWICSIAWPFDQGTDGKPEGHGQDKLFPDENLDSYEWRALLDLLDAHQDHTYQNAKFDLEKYRVGVRRWPGLGRDFSAHTRWDTQLVNHQLWPLLPHPLTHRPTQSLKPVCEILFGSEYGDEAALVKAYLRRAKLPSGRWDLMPWDVIGSYADMDARLTMMLKLRQQWEIQHNQAGQWNYPKTWRGNRVATPADVVRLAQRRLDVMKVLYRMEWRGLPYDEAESRIAAMECDKRAQVLAKDLPFAPTINAAKEFFFGDEKNAKGNVGLGLIPYQVTDTGAPSMTAEILDRMMDDGVPHAQDWAQYNKVTSASSMWYTGFAERMGTDGRLRTCFRQTVRADGAEGGTRSSRFSVERVNLQAIPQDYRLSAHSVLDGIPTPRDLIIAAIPEGWAGWELDLAQAELRVAAMWAECVLMLKMISNNEDLHGFTTRSLFPREIEAEGEGAFFKWRQVGKRGNFSLIFDAGGTTFRKMVSKETGIQLSDTKADLIVRDWRRLYPEFHRAVDQHMGAVAKRQVKFGKGWVDLLSGERSWFEQYEDAHKAFNRRVQGNLAQFGIDWMLQSDQYLRSCGLDQETEFGRGGLILTIHDSQFLLLPDSDEGAAMANTCAEFGKALWKDTFPGVPGDVDIKRWQKK